MIQRRDFLLSASTLAAFPMAAVAQADFPGKPITMVVVFPPGQAGDILARILSEAVSKVWGQSLVIDNKAGAAGTIGSAFVARARPDGSYHGIETAPFSFLLSCWRARSASVVSVAGDDFWRADFAQHDMVYAYLSPQPMARLWQTAQREMQPGACW